jgi:hypothetical protein
MPELVSLMVIAVRQCGQRRASIGASKEQVRERSECQQRRPISASSHGDMSPASEGNAPLETNVNRMMSRAAM